MARQLKTILKFLIMIFNPWELAKYIKAIYREQMAQKEMHQQILYTQSLILKRLRNMAQTMDEFVKDINDTFAEQQKSLNEIKDLQKKLDEALANQNNVPEAVASAWAQLKTAIKAQDDLIPDAVQPPVDPTTPAGETPVGGSGSF